MDRATSQGGGTRGSAVAGLCECIIRSRYATPRPVWNPDEKRTHDFYADWQKVPENVVYDNGFKALDGVDLSVTLRPVQRSGSRSGPAGLISSTRPSGRSAGTTSSGW